MKVLSVSSLTKNAFHANCEGYFQYVSERVTLQARFLKTTTDSRMSTDRNDFNVAAGRPSILQDRWSSASHPCESVKSVVGNVPQSTKRSVVERVKSVVKQDSGNLQMSEILGIRGQPPILIERATNDKAVNWLQKTRSAEVGPRSGTGCL